MSIHFFNHLFKEFSFNSMFNNAAADTVAGVPTDVDAIVFDELAQNDGRVLIRLSQVNKENYRVLDNECFRGLFQRHHSALHSHLQSGTGKMMERFAIFCEQYPNTCWKIFYCIMQCFHPYAISNDSSLECKVLHGLFRQMRCVEYVEILNKEENKHTLDAFMKWAAGFPGHSMIWMILELTHLLTSDRRFTHYDCAKNNLKAMIKNHKEAIVTVEIQQSPHADIGWASETLDRQLFNLG